MDDLDQRIWDSPEYSVGLARHSAAVKRIESMEGTVYLPELSNIQCLRIGPKAKIHSHVWIGKEVSIGSNVLMQAYVFIPDRVTIGDRVFIGPRVTFTNEKHPLSGVWQDTVVKNDVCIGAGAIILPGVTLGEGCVVGAGSVVTKDIPPGETWVGNPARKLETP